MTYLSKLRVVIESPCKAQPESTWDDHQQYLRRCLQDSIGKNEAPIASHGLFAFPGIFDDADPLDRALCMDAGWAWIPHAEKLCVYTDYGITEGMRRAINIAHLHGIPVSYRQLGKNEAPAS